MPTPDGTRGAFFFFAQVTVLNVNKVMSATVTGHNKTQ